MILKNHIILFTIPITNPMMKPPTQIAGIIDANTTKVQNKMFFSLPAFINLFTKNAPIPVIKINAIIFLCFKVIQNKYTEPFQIKKF